MRMEGHGVSAHGPVPAACCRSTRIVCPWGELPAAAGLAGSADRYEVPVAAVDRCARGLPPVGWETWMADSPADTFRVVDTLGAGDCFNAGLLFRLLEVPGGLEEALRFACR